MNTLNLKTPIKSTQELKAGDIVYLTGTLYTMRDSAHVKALNSIDSGGEVPFDLKNGVLWHAGPLVKGIGTQAKVVAAGSTTSSRLNEIEPKALEKLGFKLIIGKGGMNINKALQDNKAAYLATVGGCAAFLADKVEKVENIYWPELGMAEAVYELKVKDFGPLIVAIDSKGNNLYEKVLEKVK
jgi:fumarate hydratase subunit beta